MAAGGEPPFRVLFKVAVQRLRTVDVGFALQFATVRGEDGSACVLLSRDRELTSRIVDALLRAAAEYGTQLQVVSDDSTADQRIQSEVLGGLGDSLRHYALYLRSDESGVPSAVTLLVTDERALLCDENFLETEGKASRYVLRQIEGLEDLTTVTVDPPAAPGALGRLSLTFGARSVFKQRGAGVPPRRWELLSPSHAAMLRTQKELNQRVGALLSKRAPVGSLTATSVLTAPRPSLLQ
jgi:hypothetical protein